MSTVTLKGYNATEFSFANKLPHGTQIKLGNKYQYNVKYAANNNCVGEMNIKVFDREREDQFFLNLTLRGVFGFAEGAEKEQVHVDSYKTLFPYARALVTTLTANAGIPPIIIPEADIESQSIYRFDLGGNKPKST
ncbi:MAG: protein-export chaperone SecB [Clostridia bacterium]|nr:protein-export chaperone SecB [Clostridia bacterium]